MFTSAHRLVAVGGAVAAVLAFTTSTVTAAVAPPSATVSPATCVGRDGQVQVTLNAGGADTTIAVYLDSVFFNDYALTAGASKVVTFSGLSDVEHEFKVQTEPPGGDVGTILADELRTPSCDSAPLPYSNAKGSMAKAGCSAVAVAASNAVDAAKGTDLQPVTFELDAKPLSGGVLVPLATFVLDSGTPTYHHTVKLASLSGPSRLTLSAGGTTLASATLRSSCTVTVTTPHPVTSLPDTGA